MGIPGTDGSTLVGKIDEPKLLEEATPISEHSKFVVTVVTQPVNIPLPSGTERGHAFGLEVRLESDEEAPHDERFRNGAWAETFGSEAEVRACLKGMQIAAAMLGGQPSLRLPQIPPTW